jgi:hypothetical protein
MHEINIIMAYVSILDRVREKLKKEPFSNNQAGSIRWYRDQIRKLSEGPTGHFYRGDTLRPHLLADRERETGNILPGLMYLFVYDPKYKRTLPYYDRFPLVFPIEYNREGFIGLNLHYLGYNARLELFRQLELLSNRNQNDPRARIQIAYRMLKGFARFKAYKPCFKKYLFQHVRSHYVRITAPDWETALFLPVEHFVKRSKTFVWNDSERIISGEQSGPTGLPKNSNVPHTSTRVTSPVQSPVSSNGLPTKS